MEFEFKVFAEWAFYGLVGYSSWEIKESIKLLNTQVATILAKMEWHERELIRHDHRIRELEIVNN